MKTLHENRPKKLSTYPPKNITKEEVTLPGKGKHKPIVFSDETTEVKPHQPIVFNLKADSDEERDKKGK